MTIYTDAFANPNLGWGIYITEQGLWSYGRWDPQFFRQYQLSIGFLEMYVMLIFLDVKRHQLENHHLQFFSDNQPTVDALTSKSSPSKQLMTIIWIITSICLHHNIHFTILHTRGKANIQANLLCRIKLNKFMQQVEDFKALQYLKPQGQAWPLSVNTLRSWPAWLTDQQPMESTTAWELFNWFLTVYNKQLHALCDLDLVEFISMLSLIPLAGTTIRTYVSGVRHHLKIKTLARFPIELHNIAGTERGNVTRSSGRCQNPYLTSYAACYV